MDGNRKHYRVALQELRENPDKGIYLTQSELKKYGIFAGAMAVIPGYETKLLMLLHWADMWASRVIEGNDSESEGE